MKYLTLVLLLWMAGSTVAFIGCWLFGVVAYLRLAADLARLKEPSEAPASRRVRVREICRDRSHPLHGRARRLLRFVWAAGIAWLSGILALLAFAASLHVHA